MRPSHAAHPSPLLAWLQPRPSPPTPKQPRPHVPYPMFYPNRPPQDPLPPPPRPARTRPPSSRSSGPPGRRRLPRRRRSWQPRLLPPPLPELNAACWGVGGGTFGGRFMPRATLFFAGRSVLICGCCVFFLPQFGGCLGLLAPVGRHGSAPLAGGGGASFLTRPVSPCPSPSPVSGSPGEAAVQARGEHIPGRGVGGRVGAQRWQQRRGVGAGAGRRGVLRQRPRPGGRRGLQHGGGGPRVRRGSPGLQRDPGHLTAAHT